MLLLKDDQLKMIKKYEEELKQKFGDERALT